MSTVPQLLAARAAAEPERTALLLPDGRRLTFAQWQERATAVAYGFVARGVRPGDRVALRFGGADWLDYAVAYCGAHLAGGVAVPVSAALAPAEVDHVLAHSGAVSFVDGPGGLVAGPPVALPTVTPDDPAQIVYTSGTTGRPKGVVASHANVTFGFGPAPRQRRFAHSDVFVHAFPIGTNGAQTMLMYALAAQPAALCLARFDSERFAAAVREHRAGTVFLVPSMAIDLLDSGAHQRYDLSSVLLVTSSAAALPPAVATGLAAAFPDATIVNYYSSTESGPADTTMIVDPSRPASGGRPANPGDLAIRDGSGADLPPGQIGDVWLRSPVAPRAYFADPAGTAATFRDGWVRMGDVGYLDDDGYLFLVDRERDVIKSGGLKVSTLAVEAALHEHPAVSEAAVLGIPHPVLGSAVAAAVVLRDPVPAAELRRFLTGRLAGYQVPTRLVTLDSLPRNETGKVVKRDLVRLFEPRDAVAPTPLRTPAEQTLGRLWREVLGVPAVGADDDFFALGGESLKATQLATLATDAFGVDVGVSLVFDAPALREQAAAIAARAPLPAAPVPAAATGDEPGPVLGSTQEYFLHWMHQTPVRRQIQPVNVALRIRDALDVAVLERALNGIVRRHELLRAVFPRDGNGFRMEVRDELPVAVSTVDARDEEHARQLACAAVERPFDIATGPLLRAEVIRLGDEDQVLVLAIEHLAFDGASFAVLLRELGMLYSALRLGDRYPLAPLPLTASRFYAEARREWAGNRDFWKQRLDGAPPAVSPIPGHDPSAVRYVGRSVEFTVPAHDAQRLRDAARDTGATTFMAALAAWCRVLHDWTGVRDVVVQTPVTGRTRPEYATVVGCLVQLLMVRIPVSATDSFEELLRTVRARVVEAADHQTHRFLEPAGMVPYPVHFFFESWGGPAHLPGLESEPFPLPPELCLTWRFAEGDPDLSVPRLSLVERPDGTIAGRLLYNAEALDRSGVERLAEAFVSFLKLRR